MAFGRPVKRGLLRPWVASLAGRAAEPQGASASAHSQL